MIEQNVQVVRCQGKRMWVRMGSQTGCAACDDGKGCGAGLFSKLLRRKPVIIELERDDADIEAGQMLTLAFPEQVFIRLVFASYGLPLLAALAGAILGHGVSSWLQLGPAMVDLGALTGALLAAGLALRLIRNRSNTDKIFNSLQKTLYYPSLTPNMCNASSRAAGENSAQGHDPF